MRITEFPVLREIKDEYIQLRRSGNDRAAAVQKLMESYKYDLQNPDEDDAQLFWVGLADAQYYRKELMEEVAQKALHALDVIQSYEEWDICAGDLNRRREHYAQAPMPERKVGKPKPKFRCEWKIGDTFAYRLTGQDAEEFGLSGKYMLLRKVADVEWGDGALYPIMTVSLWDSETLPVNSQEFMSVPLLKLATGRCFSPKNLFEYRLMIFVKNRKQLSSVPLSFIGNFAEVQLPDDEMIFTEPGVILIMVLERLGIDLCLYWKRNRTYLSI